MFARGEGYICVIRLRLTQALCRMHESLELIRNMCVQGVIKRIAQRVL